jgi:hypothetical protein
VTLAPKALSAVGWLALLVGLVWMGQGSGYFPYPATSFMIDQTPWIWRGLAVAVIGVAIILASRRLRRG